MVVVNENSTAILTLSFYDEENDPIIPTSGRYKVTDKESGTLVTDWTSFNPSASTHDLPITESETTILDSSNNYETRMVWVEYEYGVGGKGSDLIEYSVKNFDGVSLCSIDDVKNEGGLSSDANDEQIAYKIDNLSEYLLSEKSPTATDYDLKMCCVYGVLAWLEAKKLIPTTRQAMSMTEGDTTQMFQQGGQTKNYVIVSNEENYFLYLAKILPLISPGRAVGVNAEYYPFSE